MQTNQNKHTRAHIPNEATLQPGGTKAVAPALWRNILFPVLKRFTKLCLLCCP